MGRRKERGYLEIEKREKEKAFCFGLALSRERSEEELERSLDELSELVRACEGEVVGRLSQRRPQVDPATYIGKGKLEELKTAAEEAGANLLVCDDELSPAQLRNIEDCCQMKVIDRSLLILDIFARRAKTAEGKLQVELAQQAYLLPRLQAQVGFHSRTGGGIGTRGPGETIMDRDRRHIRRRMDHLRKELKNLEERRKRDREKRTRHSGLFTIAVVGYTNAGKSTLVNALCKSELYAEDMVFATLDPASRRLPLPELKNEVIMTDTVGFVRKLPHHLVEAFKSTLEEAAHADLILHVVDAADPHAADCVKVCLSLLHELGADQVPRISLLNKMDQVDTESLDPELFSLLRADRSSELRYISALNRDGLESLRRLMADELLKLGASPREEYEE